MRLYSRGQMVFVGLGGMLLAFLLALGLGFIRLSGTGIAVGPSEGTLAGSATSAAADTTSAAASGSTASSAALADAPAAGALSDSAPAGLRKVDAPSLEFNTDERENIDVYERLNEGVVNITTEVMAMNWFLEPVPQDGGTGSGSIIDTRGYVLTNNHVVKDAYKLFVNLADGSRYEAKVVGADPENDLAVIKFDAPKGIKLTVIPYGDSTNLKVGQKVLAIGNPFGFDRTLTQGIVSSLGRPIQESDKTIIRNMVQTDASINPGNSGGPLLNARGEMIGVNTMIYSPSGASVGIGFAVPVNTAKRIVPQLIKDGMVRRGWLEIDTVQLIPELVDYMKQNGIPSPVSTGILVSQARRGGNADRAGIKGGATAVRYGRSTFYVGGDIIVSVNGMKIGSIADFYSALETTKPDDRVEVEYYRGTKKLTAQVVLSDRTKSGIQE
jgi:S1-C subfamily serine protease